MNNLPDSYNYNYKGNPTRISPALSKPPKRSKCKGSFDTDGFCEECGSWYKHQDCQIKKLEDQIKVIKDKLENLRGW